MGIGRASGENRAAEAARQATASPLLEISITGAQGILFNITGGANLGLFEVNEAAEIIKETADPEANIIFGTVIDERMGDEVMITVIATGFDSSRKREIARAASQGQGSGGYAVRSSQSSASSQMFISNGAGSTADTDDVAAGLRAGRDNRDYLRELEQERTASEPAAPAADTRRPPTGRERQDRADVMPRRTAPAHEVEDLDIPAFLRRNR
jgi:hypothetical protein